MVTHKHHIVPRHIGGSDDPENLIELTVEEHAEAHKKLYEEHGRWQDYVAWQGLAKLTPKAELAKIRQLEARKNQVIGPMSDETKKKISDKLIGHSVSSDTKEKISKANTGKISSLKGKPLNDKHRENLSIAQQKRFEQHSGTMLGKKHVPESIEKIKEARKQQQSSGWTWSDEQKEKQRLISSGKTHTDDSKQKISEALKGVPKPKATCPHCGKIGGVATMKQWHFDNCKEKK